MTYRGTVTRVLTTKTGATLIIDTEIGPRGIELDRHDWVHLLRRADETDPNALVGWEIDYDPTHGSIDLIDPDEFEDDEEDNPNDEANDDDLPAP